MLTLVKLAETVRCALNDAHGDADFFNDFIAPLVTAGKIKNKEKEHYELSASRVSLILNQNADVPGALRQVIKRYGIKEKLIPEYKEYFECNCDSEKSASLKENLLIIANEEKIKVDPNMSLQEIFVELLFQAIKNRNDVDDVVKVIYKSGVNSADVVVADIFRYGFDNRRKRKSIVVIPVNTTFETHVSRQYEEDPTPLVSANTLHGDWLDRWCKTGKTIEELDNRIHESLKRRGYDPISKEPSENGKEERYPIGSIAVIEDKNAIYYLTALSEFDKKNRAHSTKDDVTICIERILQMYDFEGQGNDIYIPLLGTGRSRAGLTLQESYETIVNGIQNGIEWVQGKVHIVIFSKQGNEVEL